MVTTTHRQLDHKLHPRTAFMTFVPGVILVALVILVLFSPHKGKLSGIELFAAAAAVNYGAVAFALWSDRGHSVYWDGAAIHVRQPGGALFFRRHPYASVPFDDIRGLKLLPPPRGVPPKYPLVEIDAPSTALRLDPNYFTRGSLTIFINALREHLPQMRTGAQSKIAERLLKLFADSSGTG